MRDFSKKRRGKGFELLRFLLGVLGVVFLAFLVVVSARAAWGMYQKFEEASRGRETTEQELYSLQEKKERVSASVLALTSPRGVEAEIRQRFGVAKPGEGEIKIVRDEKEGAESETEPQNLWERIVKMFFGW